VVEIPRRTAFEKVVTKIQIWSSRGFYA